MPSPRNFMRPDWFPDWKDQTVVIIGGGPSAGLVKYELYAGRAKFFAVTTSWKLCPWADALVSADAGWWRKHKMVPSFRGLKITCDFTISHENPGIHQIMIDKLTNGLSMDKPRYVGMGYNSGFYAINLACQFGPPKNIILTGFEMHKSNGVHWHGLHPAGLNNPGNEQFNKWRPVMDAISGALKELGVTVINACPTSALRNYPKMTFEEAWARVS